MPSQVDVSVNVLESIAATVVVSSIAFFVKWVTEHPPTYERVASGVHRSDEIDLPGTYPVTAPLEERLAWLLYRTNENSLATADASGAALASHCLKALQNLSFLRLGDEVLFQEAFGTPYVLTLQVKIGDGPTHQTWKAVGPHGKITALKFLKQYSPFAISAEGFLDAARLTNRAAAAGADLPAVLFNSAVEAPQLPAHYARAFIEGDSLRSQKSNFISQKSFEERLAVGITELAETFTVLDNTGISAASINPENILVRKQGGWRLVDLDHAIDTTCHAPGNALRSNEIGYAPPEVLQGDVPGPRAHVYSLARIVLFLYWSSDNLPSPYEMLNSRVIDQINCGLFMKRVLRKATCLHPEDRHDNAAHFAAALQVAVQKGGSRAPVIALLFDERDNTRRLLRHTFWGTAIAMLIVRPPFAIGAELLSQVGYPFPQYGLIELSNRFLVGAFHGIIGGLIWGIIIPGAFLLYWASHLRFNKFGVFWAALMCASAGFLGGILCAFGSVLITNATTLHQLGWVLSANDQMGNWPRFHDTIKSTHMFFAFPLTGTLTGIAAAIFLNHYMQKLVCQAVKGLDPVPIKIHLKEVGTIFSAMRFVLRPSPWLAVLLIPTLSAITALWLHGADVPRSAEEVRAFGEGMVHMFGLIGLTVGFFYGIISAPSKESRWTRFTVGIRKRLLALSSKERDAEATAGLDV